jgi:hypothetical protein
MGTQRPSFAHESGAVCSGTSRIASGVSHESAGSANPQRSPSASHGVGLAWWFSRYADEKSAEDRRRYKCEEEDARLRTRGLWVDEAPVPPWEWGRAIGRSSKGALAKRRDPPYSPSLGAAVRRRYRPFDVVGPKGSGLRWTSLYSEEQTLEHVLRSRHPQPRGSGRVSAQTGLSVL